MEIEPISFSNYSLPSACVNSRGSQHRIQLLLGFFCLWIGLLMIENHKNVLFFRHCINGKKEWSEFFPFFNWSEISADSKWKHYCLEWRRKLLSLLKRNNQFFSLRYCIVGKKHLPSLFSHATSLRNFTRSKSNKQSSVWNRTFFPSISDIKVSVKIHNHSLISSTVDRQSLKVKSETTSFLFFNLKNIFFYWNFTSKIAF